MEKMPPSAPSPDLLDLKLMPAWVKESPAARDYSDFEGEDGEEPRRGRDRPHDRARRPDRPRGREEKRDRNKRRPDHKAPHAGARRREDRPTPAPPPAVTVRFLPHGPALESVIAQIKGGPVTYSVYALARLFLEKPERYNVRLTSQTETPLYQLGEHGPVSSEQRLLENTAFPALHEEFYNIEVTQAEPIKGNFTNVARCRASGTLLGPTNHHSYQAQLRNLYEQRFSRRMSFADYQRQIEIVSDPAAVEEWKERARNITTYLTKQIDPPLTFQNSGEAERHFRQHHLPGLVRSAPELTISGVLSRRLPDRPLHRLIENAWVHETRSPSNMMQELAGALRQAGLNIFRHRRGMLFVSPVRIHGFQHENASVSDSIKGILAAVSETPGLHRKDLAGKLIPAELESGETERMKMTLAADLRWLISEGYMIEFNDGSLDLPRTKQAETKPLPNEQKENAAVAAEPVAQAEEKGPETSVVVSTVEGENSPT
jgi:hypothetical protein